MCSPFTNVTRHRRMLETALLRADMPACELLAMSQRLDRLINHTMRVRSGRFRRAPLRAVRRRVRSALP